MDINAKLVEHEGPHAAKQADLDAMSKGMEEKLRSGKVGAHSGVLFTRGKLWGWAERFAVLQGPFLNFYAKAEDYVISNPAWCLNVSGCQANLCNASKHGRDFTMELIIANPRSVHPIAAPSMSEIEAWIEKLGKVGTNEESTEGRVGHLTDDQAKKLQALKDALGAEAGEASDADLLRFMRWNVFDPAASATMFKETELWRKQFNVANLKVNSVSKELRLNKMRVLPVGDKAGHPIIVFRPATHNPGTSSPLEVCKLLVYNIELCIKRMKAPVEGVVFIIDLSDVRPRNVDLRVPKMLIETMQYRYPERITKILVVNAPWFFRFVWATVRTFFNPNFLEKVQILGSDMSTLQAFIPLESLLTEHGGVLTWDAEEFIRERSKEEGVDVEKEEAGGAKVFDGGLDKSLMESLQELPASEVREGALRTGFMTKLGGIVKNWKKRFFVLTDTGLLYYYKEESSASPQGVIVLERSNVGDVTDETSKKDAFTLVTPMRTYVFCCENSQELKEWKEAIGSVCARL